MSEVVKENKALKITKLVINIVFYVLIFVLLLFSIANLNKKDDTEVPNLFGSGFTTVESDSMDSTITDSEGNKVLKFEDSFTKEDIVFLKVVNDKNREKKLADLEIGDIIAFKYLPEGSNKYVLNTHRIVDIKQDASGEDYYITQGDHVALNDHYKYDPNSDSNDPTKYEVVNANDIRGIYSGKWSGAGKAFKFIQEPTGFLLCVVLPVAAFFIYELVVLLISVFKIKQHKNSEKHEEEMAKIKEEQEKMLEEERARIRAEILAEQNKKNNEENKSDESNDSDEDK